MLANSYRLLLIYSCRRITSSTWFKNYRLFYNITEEQITLLKSELLSTLLHLCKINGKGICDLNLLYRGITDTYLHRHKIKTMVPTPYLIAKGQKQFTYLLTYLLLNLNVHLCTSELTDMFKTYVAIHCRQCKSPLTMFITHAGPQPDKLQGVRCTRKHVCQGPRSTKKKRNMYICMYVCMNFVGSATHPYAYRINTLKLYR